MSKEKDEIIARFDLFDKIYYSICFPHGDPKLNVYTKENIKEIYWFFLNPVRRKMHNTVTGNYTRYDEYWKRIDDVQCSNFLAIITLTTNEIGYVTGEYGYETCSSGCEFDYCDTPRCNFCVCQNLLTLIKKLKYYKKFLLNEFIKDYYTYDYLMRNWNLIYYLFKKNVDKEKFENLKMNKLINFFKKI